MADPSSNETTTRLGSSIGQKKVRRRLSLGEDAHAQLQGSAAAVTTPSQLSGHIRFGQPALQHRDRGQEIAASGSQISSKDRVRAIGGIGDTRPLLLLLDVGVEKLNAPTQITDEHVQFHGGAGMVQ
jgi:hypothetical protein